jgi:hypothetical protein
MKEDHEYFLNLAVENKLATSFKSERFTIIKFNEQVQEFLLSEVEYAGYVEYIKSIRNHRNNVLSL